MGILAKRILHARRGGDNIKRFLDDGRVRGDIILLETSISHRKFVLVSVQIASGIYFLSDFFSCLTRFFGVFFEVFVVIDCYCGIV